MLLTAVSVPCQAVPGLLSSASEPGYFLAKREQGRMGLQGSAQVLPQALLPSRSWAEAGQSATGYAMLW